MTVQHAIPTAIRDRSRHCRAAADGPQYLIQSIWSIHDDKAGFRRKIGAAFVEKERRL
jgi:hypothetical protein